MSEKNPQFESHPDREKLYDPEHQHEGPLEDIKPPVFREFDPSKRPELFGGGTE